MRSFNYTIKNKIRYAVGVLAVFCILLSVTVIGDTLDLPQTEANQNQNCSLGIAPDSSDMPFSAQELTPDISDTGIFTDAGLFENDEQAVEGTLSTVTLDSTGVEDIPETSSANETMVLRVAPNSTGMPFFGQWTALEKGKTYVFSNYYLPETELHQFVYLKHENNDYDTSDFTAGSISDYKMMLSGTKFTVPATALTDTNGKVPVWVGIRGYKTSEPLYYCDFKLYDVNNPSINLLKDADLSSGDMNLDRTVWLSPYNTAIKDTISKVTLASVGGIDIFKNPSADEPKVLKLEPNSTGMPFFGQWVTLQENKTYIFSNCYLTGTELHQKIWYKHSDGNYDASDLTDEVIYDFELSRQSIKFTVPTTAPDDSNGKVQIWVGIRGYKSDTPLYYYNFSLYDVANPDVNLLKDPDLIQNEGEIDKSVWISPYNTAIKDSYSKVTLKEAGGMEIFASYEKKCDTNFDKIIDLRDLVRLKSNCMDSGSTLPDGVGDLDSDGTVKAIDLILLKQKLLK